MKKLIAIVMSVMLLAGLLGIGSVALADKPGGWSAGEYSEYNGNGAPSGAHYNLNIIGVSSPKSNPMTNSNGHTIFVPLKGRATINLINSEEETATCNGKEFKVVDHNATDDGVASFCLPPPQQAGDNISCPADWTKYEWSVWARALGNNGGRSFMTTCMESGGEAYCSSITLKLEKENPPKFTDVSKYLLFIYTDIGKGFKRYPIFSPAGEGYRWDYINDNQKLVQLRFYQVETCIPPASAIPYASANVTCLEIPGAGSITTPVEITGSTDLPRKTEFTNITEVVAYDCAGEEIGVSNVVVTSDTLMTLDLTTDWETCYENKKPLTLLITYDLNAGGEWTIRVDFKACN